MSMVLSRLGPDLVTNGDFETNNGAADFGTWTEQVSGTSTVTVAVGAGYTGDGCRFTLDGSSSFVQIYQTIARVAGATYRVGLNAKISDAAGTNHLEVAIGGGVGLKQSLALAWTPMVYDVVAGGTDSLLYVARGNSVASDSLWIDDVTCRRDFGEVTLPTPSFGNMENSRRIQSATESLGGTFYVYDRGVAKREWMFRWNGNLLRQGMEDLRAFFEDVAEGMKNTFQIVVPNWRPTLWRGSGTGTITIPSVRFARPEIDFQEIADGHYVAEIVLREDAD